LLPRHTPAFMLLRYFDAMPPPAAAPFAPRAAAMPSFSLPFSSVKRRVAAASVCCRVYDASARV